MLIFSYGSLRNKEVQRTNFEEYLRSLGSDTVSGFSLEQIRIENDLYPIAVYKKSSIVHGSILEVPNRILHLVDKYEGDSYKRIEIKTVSGIICQMYIKR